MLTIGNYAPDDQPSMQRYAELVQSGMTEAGITSKLWLPPIWFGHLSATSNRVFKWLAYVDKLLVAPLVLLIIQWRYSRVHICDHSNAYYAFAILGRQCTVTCHDVIAIQAAQGLVPGWKVGSSGRALQWLISCGLGAVDKVYCASAFTRTELLALQLASPQRTAVALHAVDPLITAGLKAPAASPAGQRYFMHVGSDLPRKNRRFVIEMFGKLVKQPAFADCALIFIGPAPSAEQQAQLEARGLAGRTTFIQKLTNAELAQAYAGAVALLFPSKQEGFGWPVAEAQACGCPVFASALDPMMEVGGTAARYFDPDDPDAAAAIVASAPLAQMRIEGRGNSGRFTLPQMIQQLMTP